MELFTCLFHFSFSFYLQLLVSLVRQLLFHLPAFFDFKTALLRLLQNCLKRRFSFCFRSRLFWIPALNHFSVVEYSYTDLHLSIYTATSKSKYLPTSFTLFIRPSNLLFTTFFGGFFSFSCFFLFFQLLLL